MSQLAGVISQRYEPHRPDGRLVDCAWCAYLMGLAYGDATGALPFASAQAMINLREAFEDASGLPEYDPAAPVGTVQETGLGDFRPADTAAQRMYGVHLRPAVEADVETLMGTKTGLVLTGKGTGLPEGFTGNHSSFFVGLGDGRVLVYDPLAPMGSGPAVLPLSTVLTWHRSLPWDARVVTDGEFRPVPPTDLETENKALRQIIADIRALTDI